MWQSGGRKLSSRAQAGDGGRRVYFGEVREDGVGREEESCVDGLLPQGPFSEGCEVGRAVKEVSGGVGVGVAAGAGVSAGFTDAVKKRHQQLAASRSQLEEGAPPVSGETGLRLVYRGWADAQHPVGVVVVDGGSDSASVDGFEGWFVLVLWHGVVGEEV